MSQASFNQQKSEDNVDINKQNKTEVTATDRSVRQDETIANDAQ